MKKLTIISGVFIGIFIILVFISPKEFIIEKSIIINKPLSDVFNNIKYLKSHEDWNAWSKKDPSMKKVFTGVDGEVGFKSSWESENEELGTAEQEIISITEGKRFDTIIHFKKPFEGNFDSYLLTNSINENETNVVLGMHDSMVFPMTVISFIVNDCFGNRKKIELNMEESLQNLKKVLEN